MYAFISGKIDSKSDSKIIIDCNGVGYEIFATTSTIASIGAIGEFAKIYTYLHVREDAMMLFGFSSMNEKEMFLNLLNVSGVGAKTAIAILSGISVSDLLTAISFGDPTQIAKIKGVGKKTAERIILELKSSISNVDLSFLSLTQNANLESNSDVDDAVVLLSTMGLSKMEALKLVNTVYVQGDTTEDIVAKSLKNMNR